MWEICVVILRLLYLIKIKSSSLTGGVCHRTDKEVTYVSNEVIMTKLGLQSQLYCCIINSDFLGWIFMDSKIEPSSKYILTHENLINAQILSVNNVQESDSGTYFCRVNVNGHGIRDFPILLNIKAQVTNNNPRYYLEISKTDKIPLNIIGTPFPTIKFLKSDGHILVENFASRQSAKNGRYEISTNGDVIIHNVVTNDTGRYSILFTQGSGLPSEEFEFEIIVGARPFVAYVPKKYLNFTIGQNELIYTRFSGELLNIYWKFTSDVTGKSTDRIIGKTDEHYFVSVDGSLAVLNVVTTDTGTYVGVCSNPWGEVQVKTIVISAILTPQILILNDVLNSVGSNITFVAEVSGYPPPYISWWRNGVKLISVRTTPTKSELKLKSIKINDGGIYTCVADNGATLNGVRNYVKRNVTLYVSSLPEILSSKSPDMVFVTENKKIVELICVVIGSPLASITFVKDTKVYNQETIKNNQQYGNQLEASLKLTIINENQLGNYTCVATNSLGTSTFNIIVKYIDIPSPPRNIHVVQLSPFSVKIIWDISETVRKIRQSYSYLPIIWTKNHRTTISKYVSETSVIFDSLTRGERYYFSVRASNVAGWSLPSNTITFKTPLIGKPSPPIILNREIFLPTNQIRLYWTSPIDNGGDAELIYSVKRCLWDLNKITMYTDCEIFNDIRSNEIYFTGLLSFQYYDFYVVAINQIDRSDPARFQVFTGQNAIIGSPGNNKPQEIAVLILFATFLFIVLFDILLWIFYSTGVLRWLFCLCIFPRGCYEEEIPLRKDSIISQQIAPKKVLDLQQNDIIDISGATKEFLEVEDHVYQQISKVSKESDQITETKQIMNTVKNSRTSIPVRGSNYNVIENDVNEIELSKNDLDRFEKYTSSNRIQIGEDENPKFTNSSYYGRSESQNIPKLKQTDEKSLKSSRMSQIPYQESDLKNNNISNNSRFSNNDKSYDRNYMETDEGLNDMPPISFYKELNKKLKQKTVNNNETDVKKIKKKGSVKSEMDTTQQQKKQNTYKSEKNVIGSKRVPLISGKVTLSEPVSYKSSNLYDEPSFKNIEDDDEFDREMLI